MKVESYCFEKEEEGRKLDVRKQNKAKTHLTMNERKKERKKEREKAAEVKWWK